MMIADPCEACERMIHVLNQREFHYTEQGDGPFCDPCWFFMRHIEALLDRVTDLEAKLREPVRTRSPYDLSKQRQTRRQQI